MLTFLHSPALISTHDYWKNHSFVGRVMSLLFNKLSRLVITFLPSSKRLLISWLQSQRLKRLPPMQETWVRSLGREDPLEKEMVAHSSILAWRIPWMEKPGRLQSTGLQRVGHD